MSLLRLALQTQPLLVGTGLGRAAHPKLMVPDALLVQVCALVAAQRVPSPQQPGLSNEPGQPVHISHHCSVLFSMFPARVGWRVRCSALGGEGRAPVRESEGALPPPPKRAEARLRGHASLRHSH